MNRRIFTLLTLLSLALLLPVLSYGQAISGDLTGVVKDRREPTWQMPT